jgi:quercetin dioxygenase-like cupin family protein
LGGVGRLPTKRPQQSSPLPRGTRAPGGARFGLPSIHARSAATQLEDNADMDIKPLGATPSRRMGADSFTGTVWQDPIIEAPAPARIRGAWVRFEPKARTAWHTHPLGQTLIVTAGCGRTQREGGPIEEIRPGDVVWIAPKEKHWHGAAPTTAMTHIAIQEALDGKAVDWMEKVGDEQYKK